MVDFMPVGEPKYDKVIEEYEEEILVQEEASEPFGADLTDPSPAQGKPRCITLILNDRWIYIYDVHLRYRYYGNYMHKYIYLWVLLVQVE